MTLQTFIDIEDVGDIPRWRAPLRSPLELVGVPYVRGGVTPAVGFDCFTLVSYVRWHCFQKITPLIAVRPRRSIATSVLAALAIRRTLGSREFVSPWLRCEAHSGCAVALGRTTFGRLHHCGVFVDAGVLHALDSCGVVWTPATRIATLYGRVEYYECD